MLFAAIGHPDLLREIPPGVDGVELRVDLFPEMIDISAVKLPVMIAPGNLPQDRIEELLKLDPPFSI